MFFFITAQAANIEKSHHKKLLQQLIARCKKEPAKGQAEI